MKHIRQGIADGNEQSSCAQLPPITRNEWLWAGTVGAVVLVVTFLPYMLGWLSSTKEAVYTGFFFMQGDAYSYLAKMRLGAQGYWLFQDVYAVEPHHKALIYFPYILAGHAAGLIGGPRTPVGPFIAVFHAWRVLAAALLMWALYRFYSLLLPRVNQRRMAYVLSLAGGGLGGLAVLIGYGIIDGYRPIDLYLGEAYGFVALLAWPHVLTARACALLALIRLFPMLSQSKGTWRDTVIIGALWLVMALCVPFYLLVAAAVAAACLILISLRRRRMPWKGMLWGGLAGLPAGLANVATLMMIRGDAVYDSWNAQNSLPTVPLWNLALAFGLPLLLAIIGGYVAWHKHLPLVELCLGWILAAGALLMVPLNVQLRLIEGAYIPLWGLAVPGITRLLDRVARSGWLRLALLGIFLAVSLLTSAFLVLGGSAVSTGRAEGVFISGDLDATLEWLNRSAPPGSVLLASEPVGIYAPARAGIRVVVGHGFETPYFDRKEVEVRAFYTGELSDEQKVILLERYHVDYVLSGPVDWQWACSRDRCVEGAAGLDSLPLRIVYRQGAVAVYQVMHE